MATTIPEPLILTDPSAEILDVYDLYCRALGDADKAGDIEDGIYYTGYSDALRDALLTLGAIADAAAPVDFGVCAYCETALRCVDGVWIDDSCGDVCVGDLDNVNENQPHVLAIPELETEK